MEKTELFYTVKDIAELLQVSKPTIQKAINDLQIEPDRIEKNKYRLYSAADAAAIIHSVRPDFDLSVLRKGTEKLENDRQEPQNEPQTPPSDTEKPQTQTAKPQEDSQAELYKSVFAALQEQLAIKDRQIAAYEAQIAAKDKQIEDYSQRLKEAMQLTHGQQLITAADKVERIAAAAPAAPAEDFAEAAEPTTSGTDSQTMRAATLVFSSQESAEPEAPAEEQTAAPAKKKSFWNKLKDLWGD